MALQAGMKLGPYEILSPLGVGGMGEVYLARDAKLAREVAIKVLPEAMTNDHEPVARFEREAKLLASLNHPNIASVHGFDESNGTRFLVLEYVDGETLGDHLKNGPIAVEDALDIAKQIAEALEAAHGQGIIHRDLKPANVMIRPDGTVKVLDFGLAKAMAEEPSGVADADAPTITDNYTRPGVVLGTAAYMSPEQARGRSLDKRTDIWSFGIILFECLTGKRLFQGETANDSIGAIMHREPDWSLLPPRTSRTVKVLLRRCLTKDTKQRLRDIGDARIAIAEAIHDIETGTSDPPEDSPPKQGRRGPVLTGLAIGLVLGAILTIGIALRWPSQTERGSAASPDPVVRSVIDLPATTPLALGTINRLLIALSPDGTQLVYVGESDQGSRLYRREMASFDDPEPIPGTDGAIHPFFSPNGRWIGFLTEDKLKKVSLRGGDPQTLCDVRTAGRANWMRDDVIYFAAHDDTIIQRVSAWGGETETVTEPFMWARLSQVLPDGRTALLTSASRGISLDYGDIVLLDLASLETTVLVEYGYEARYVPTGHILFSRGGNLLAVGFDLERRQVTGEPIRVVTGVGMNSLFGNTQVAISDNGTLVYAPGGERASGKIAWIDREGKEEILPVESRVYGVLDLAPEADRIAVQVADVHDYIWIYDLERKEGRKLRSGRQDGWPVWAPDGNAIAFSTEESGRRTKILSQRIDAQEESRELFSHDFLMTPSAWSSDGLVIAVHTWPRPQLGFISLGATPKIRWVEAPGVNQWGPTFSPNGKWVAYASDKTGRNEVWVRSYPDGSIVRQISVDGAWDPVWCRDCDELFFHNGKTWLAVKMTVEPELAWDPPHVAFETDYISLPGRDYDISADGQRLFVIKSTKTGTRTRLHTITNWFDELNRLVPTGTGD